MRLLLLALFLMFAIGSKAQDEPAFYHPNTFFLDSGQPFLTLDSSITANMNGFEFMLFNRWGELFAETDQHDFIIDDIVGDKFEGVQEGEVFVWRIKIYREDDVEEYVGHTTYMGYYCPG